MGASQSSSPSYSVSISDSQNPNHETGVRRASTHPSELVKSSPGRENLNNCFDIFSTVAFEKPDKLCLGYRPQDSSGKLRDFEWISYIQVRNMAIALGTEIISRDLVKMEYFPDPNPKCQSLRNFGLFSSNRREWLILEQTCNAFNLTIVPLYDVLGSEIISFILNQTKMSCCMVSSKTILPVLKAKPSCPYLLSLICIDQIAPEEAKLALEVAVELHAYKDLLSEGLKKPQLEPTPGDIDSVNTLCYTSGTTGKPKGVILTHGNFINTCFGTFRGQFSRKGMTISEDESHISYLPLAHVFERMICNLAYYAKCRIGVYSGDILNLLNDIQVLNPVLMISVPRLFNRISDRVMAGVRQKSSVAQFLFHSGLNTKINGLRKSGSTVHTFWDMLVFGKLKGLLGKNMRFMFSGGAPLEAAVQERLSVIFCIPLMEGYGMTETLGATFCSIESDPLKGHVGGPMPSFEFKIESVPEMNYYADGRNGLPSGELLIRGGGVTPGYFLSPEETGQFLIDGWAHTGDIVVLLGNGAVKIIDRKKNIFKLAQGEYVCPESIENKYISCSSVGQIFVHGDSFKNSLIGIVVPDEDEAKNWFKGKDGEFSLKEICQDATFKSHVLAEMDKAGTDLCMKGYEKVRVILLHPEPFTPENGLLTPTHKTKRSAVLALFENEIKDLYNSAS
eukprot:GHVP01030411.1.p1 GENE.GHVP01030411.1~~GHVP01030411.1.p1  ORF type:complete len:677 (-),score=94.08 GHVP01030411.1:648-2678(-)